MSKSGSYGDGDRIAARRIRVYSRQGCHLCEQLVEEMLPLIRNRLDLEIVDIDTRPEWISEFGTRIPVVEYAGRVICEYSLEKPLLHEILASLADS